MGHGEAFALKAIPLHLFGQILFVILVTRLHADFTGPVVSVLDGDTIEVLHNTYPERIRLSGIDCPEKGQAFGTRAKQAASALVFGRDVILQTHGQDKYKRTLADVFLTRWDPRQSCIGQRRLVLVVSEVCARGYGA